MVNEREDFIRVFTSGYPKDQSRQMVGHLKQLFSRGFGMSRVAAGQGPKTRRDDTQIWDIRDADGTDHREDIQPVLVECLRQYIEEFDVLASHSLAGWFIKAQLTRKGEGYHQWHFESSTFFDSKRVLAWTIYLNDDYEGGELEFLYYGRRIKLGTGDVVIFPAAFTHTHRGNMVTGGDKFILTGWFELVPEELGLSAEKPG